MPAFVALVAGMGLLAIAVWTLVENTRSADAVARAESSRVATLTARALRSALALPSWLESIPAARKFDVREGALVVPTELGWVARAPAPSFSDLLAPDLLALVAEARREEFERDRAEAALELLEEAAQRTDARPDEGVWLAIAAARLAERAGRVDRRGYWADEASARFDRDLEASPPGAPVHDDIVCGVALLSLSAGRDLTPKLTGALLRAQPEAALATLARAAEFSRGHDRRAEELRSLRTRIREIADRRAFLATVRPRLSALIASASGAPIRVGNELGFFFPEGDSESGRGCVVPPALLARVLDEERANGGLRSVGTAGTLVTGADASSSPDAVYVCPLVAVLPDRAGFEGTGASGILAAAFAALIVVVAAGLVLAARALARERLAVSTREEFLTAVTHELKTPLASIRLLSEMLGRADARDGDRLVKYVDRLGAESARLAMLVENVLDVGRTERGDRAYDLRPEDLARVVEETVDIYRPLATRDGLDLRASLEAPAPVSIDRGALGQVILNLLENARRYARDGRAVDITGARSGSAYRVSVRDFGAGVAAAERELVFAKFVRGGVAVASGNPGVGIGLYLARTIVRAHGGELEVGAPRDDGPGAEFVLSIPLIAPPTDATSQSPAAERKARSPAARRRAGERVRDAIRPAEPAIREDLP